MTRDLMKRSRRFSPINGVLVLMTLIFDPGFNLTVRCFKRPDGTCRVRTSRIDGDPSGIATAD